MGKDAVAAGTQAQIAQINALYTRLYNLRNTHASSSAQIKAANIPAFASTSGISAGTKATTSPLQTLKTELTQLSNSKWYQSNTAGTVVTMTDYGTALSIPAVGSLLKYTDFNVVETAITNAEGIIPTYSSKYSGCYSTCYGSCYSTCYGTCYSGQYSSCYSSCYYGCYASCYSSCYYK